MRVAFLSPWSVDDPAAWSGMIRPMARALDQELSRRGSEMVPVQVRRMPHPLDRAGARLVGMRGQGYLADHALATSRGSSRAAEQRVRELGADVVIAVTASGLVASGRWRQPIVQVTDATFGAISGFYPMFSNLSRLSLWQGDRVERRAQSRTHTFMVSSRWAANSLRKDYGVPEQRVVVQPLGPRVMPSGGSLEPKRSAQDLRSPLRVLLVASDWKRKGGPEALQVAQQAQSAGLALQLTVVGDCPSDLSFAPQDLIRPLGRVPSSAMSQIYSEHDVLLETARANAGGVTLTDAAAHGLPPIATRNGGVEDIVRHGETGLLVESTDDAVEALLVLGRNRQRLSDLAVGAREYAVAELNWEKWSSTAVDLLASAAASRTVSKVRLNTE